MCKLTVKDIVSRLSTAKPLISKPTKQNKGSRGIQLETLLDIPNSSALKDLADGELKSFTYGQSIAVTSLGWCLSEIIDNNLSYENSKVGRKLQQTIYVCFNKDGSYINYKVYNAITHRHHYIQLKEDYMHISKKIKQIYTNGETLHTINGPNKLLQIRTKANKTKGQYIPLKYKNQVLKDKYMSFYLCGKFGKSLFVNN
mgnify:CR=1 FL=1